jgi:hypothetical protein
MSTAKTMFAAGKPITPSPKDAQAQADDAGSMVAGFLLEAMFMTPIRILKGVAESSDPNIAITSTAFKMARMLVPELTSFLIPAVSIPLGTILTPITCPLPFANIPLALAYFGTLAWYDDKPSAEREKNAADELEKSIFKEKVVCNEDTKNDDSYYMDKTTPILTGEYDVKKDYINDDGILETTPEAIEQERNKPKVITSPPIFVPIDQTNTSANQTAAEKQAEDAAKRAAAHTGNDSDLDY